MQATLERLKTQATALTPGQIIAKYQTQAPVDVIGIAEELDLKVWEMSSLPDSVSGKIFKDPLNGGPSGFSIAVNARHAPVRKRFTVAHEIAHFILHRSKLDEGLVDDAMYRSSLSTKEEIESNKLAADILMPFPLIKALLDDGVREIGALALRFQVSEDAMKIRLGLPVV